MCRAIASKMYRVLKIDKDTRKEITIAICRTQEVAEDMVNYYETLSSNYDYDIRKISVDIPMSLFEVIQNIFDII